MITDYEQTLIHAIRYGLMTDKHSYRVTGYVESVISKLSDECIKIILKDIENLVDYSCLAVVQVDWICLKEQLEEEMEKRYGQADSRNT